MRILAHRPSWSGVHSDHLATRDRTGRRRIGQWWRDAGLLALGALVLRIPALLAPTNLGYDDGGYGLAAVAMRQGFAPYRDIFSPQGPLFLPLVRLADLAGFETLAAPRLLSVIAGAVVTVAVYAAARELMDRGRALLAGALTATSGALLWTTGPLTGDGPAAAFAVVAVAVALAYRRAPSTAKAVAIALLVGGAISVKNLLVAPAVLLAWCLVASRRRVLDAVVVPVGALAVLLVAAAPWGYTDVYRDAVQYHLDKTGRRKPVQNASKLVTTFVRRDLPLLAIGLLGLGAGLRHRERLRTEAVPEDRGRLARILAGSRVLWWWVGLVTAVLVLQDPMFRNHLAALVPPLALLVARYRPSWRAVAIATVVTVPFQVLQLQRLYLPRDYAGDAARVVARLHALPPGAWALSDEPGFVWRAGKATDPFFVDPSVLRIRSGVPKLAITDDRVVRAARNQRVCAVVAWAPVRFGSFAALPDRLEEMGYEQVEDFGPRRAMWVRPSCRP